MNVDYLVQPEVQLGRVLSDMLDADPPATRIVFVSAFVDLQAVVRLKQQLLDLRDAGIGIHFIVGIDLWGTSQEVLTELETWGVDVRIVKHRLPGHTFHPKLYLFEWPDRAILIVGSNNITDGGFFRNYEVAARVTYALPEDSAGFVAACEELDRFLRPDGPITQALTSELLDRLIARGEVISEIEARQRHSQTTRGVKSTGQRGVPIFGTEEIAPPPPLPAELLDRLVNDVRTRRNVAKRKARKVVKKEVVATKPIDDQVGSPLIPTAFYMTLPTLQGGIPGEGRIPLVAIELAKEFWGWPDEYTKEVSPRSGIDRVYWNWRPRWKVSTVENPANPIVQEVRMYMYENSSDFRFYARPLVNAGGDLGDVVRIRRISVPEAEYECVLARQGTPEYEQWILSCTQPVRNSPRTFGYA